ncbi:MAG: nuclear transport factor 2 family protein [Opitutae bacterium]|nr:nuclear transport factor 2 family protein [Opitutae bacterium]
MRRLLPLLLSLVAALPAFAQATPAKEPLFAARFGPGPNWDAAKPANEQKHFAEHSANLARLRRDGVILLGARYADTGLLVVHAVDADAARAHFGSDPAIAAGVFTLAVDAFNAFFPGSTNYPVTPEAVLLRAYLAAFNRHEADAVAAFCADDLKWFSVGADGKIGTDAENRPQLRDWLVGYFKSLPTVHSEFLALEQTGPILTVRERASWDNKAGQRVSQQAIGVYEVRDSRIVRVWYFPATRDPLVAK